MSNPRKGLAFLAIDSVWETIVAEELEPCPVDFFKNLLKLCGGAFNRVRKIMPCTAIMIHLSLEHPLSPFAAVIPTIEIG